MATRPPRRAAAASASTKRKALDDGSEKENSPIADEVERPKKKTKPSAAKTAAKKKQGTIKAAKSPTPTKLFNDTVKTVAKEVKKLDTAVKNLNPNNKYGIHIDSYIDIALSHVKVVQELAKTDIALAWNLALHLGDVAAPDLGRHFRLCDYGEHEEGFAELDPVLLKLIEMRTIPENRIQSLPEVRHRWTMEDADVGEFKTGRPNKQQYNQIARDRIEWDEERREERMKRRMECEDWVTVALEDLKGERDYLDKYGVEGFFKLSIARLKTLEEGRKGSDGA